jgi:hypothetical protein
MIEPFFHREYAKSLTADALKHIVEKVARADCRKRAFCRHFFGAL